ncbi:Hypothetical predicted protein [Octopus vulgaris]|uniref:Uncharacterized protein n=1 Tax=Octopus vulgaris TaxID=6645 RepID=A0AA36B789_OCTVU|nr:Hypothetical predicted protein [Octopus vulgaris]
MNNCISGHKVVKRYCGTKNHFTSHVEFRAFIFPNGSLELFVSILIKTIDLCQLQILYRSDVHRHAGNNESTGDNDRASNWLLFFIKVPVLDITTFSRELLELKLIPLRLQLQYQLDLAIEFAKLPYHFQLRLKWIG